MQHFIKDFQSFEEVKKYVSDNKFQHFILDIQTTNDKPIAVSFCFEENEVFFIPLVKKDGKKHWVDTQEKAIHEWINQQKFHRKVIKNITKVTNYNISDITKKLIDIRKSLNSQYNPLIFGKNPLQRMVSCEVNENTTELFLEYDNEIKVEIVPHKYWLVSCMQHDNSWTSLSGNLYYRYIKTYNSLRDFLGDKKRYKDSCFSVYDNKESFMLYEGYTYFKGLKPENVSILSFDIEATNLQHNKDSKVLLISNTYRKNGKVLRKLFAYDEYDSEKEFFDAWCTWVREVNPSVVVGHNIFTYDLPYMEYCADQVGTSLKLGRDSSDIRFDQYDSKFRKDGSQFYEYKRAHIYGREIIDTMFLSIKYDIARKYESYGLKQIIKHEGLEVKDRQFYDAANIADNYKVPEEWNKIKKYAEHDADDALSLYDLMIPPFFYLTQSVPKSFQSIGYSASGSQINSFLIRSYLQDGYSLPKQTESNTFEGAISIGNPGLYKNVFKVDVSSLYPSIMLEYQVYDKYKDPNKHFLKMVEYFTKERLENKKKSKDTGDRYYKDLQESQKIVINSAYGLLGAPGLLFNSPQNGSFVTKKGREILTDAMNWCQSRGFTLVNADTDSISFGKKDNSIFTDEEQKILLEDLNSLFPTQIKWEHDGIFPAVVVLKAKNYILYDGKKKKIKGSALKDPKKEKAIREYVGKVVDCLLSDQKDQILAIYNSYVKEVFNLTDITRWTTKRTVTEKVLTNERTNEKKLADAIKDKDFFVGDKAYVYYTVDETLKLQQEWYNDHDKKKLLKKLFDTTKIFQNVLDIKQFPNYTLKKSNKILEELL